MQIIFYRTNGVVDHTTVELTRTPEVADSIYVPIPQIGQLLTMSHIKGREVYIVESVEHVYADTIDLHVKLYFVKVYLSAYPSKMAGNPSK